MRETEIIDCLHSSFSISSIILHMITLLSIIITSEESLPYLLKLKEKKKKTNQILTVIFSLWKMYVYLSQNREVSQRACKTSS